jgi:hypothetical protein
MSKAVFDIHGVRILECATDGPQVRGPGDATDLIGLAWEQKAKLVALPTERLGEDFLVLATGLAGEVIQKFVNYGVGLAIVGDISLAVARSRPLHDFVYESNRGRHVWFVSDMDELAAKLERQG